MVYVKIIVFTIQFKATTSDTISRGFERHATSNMQLHKSGLQLFVQLMYFIPRIHKIFLLSEGHAIE